MQQTKTAQAEAPTLVGNFSKLIEQFKLPGIDLGAVADMWRKDIEALETAQRATLDAIQTVGNKQVELLRTTLDEIQALVKPAAASEGAASGTMSEAAQQLLQKAYANARELVETAYKSQSDVFAVLSQRLQENLQEVKALLQPKA
jgi:phasin family protein